MPSQAMSYLREMMRTGKVQSISPKPDDDMAPLRAANAASSAQIPMEPGVSFQPDIIGGVSVELSMPQTLSGDTVILYIHGGGFCFGDAVTSRGYASALAGQTGLRVYSISYRLCPEYPYPAGAQDCLSVYKALLKRYHGQKIVLLGDSGGGYFSLVTSLMARDQGLPLPACLCLFSPVTTLAEELPSRKSNAEIDCMLSGDLNEQLIRVYIRDNQDLHHPYISPLYGDYTGFPPIKIVADGSEVLLDDSIELASQVRKAGVEVDIHVMDNTSHAFPNMGRGVPESNQILMETATFISIHCS